MTAFPALSPTSRSVTQGQYAVKRFNSIAGTGTSRIYGSQPFNSQLSLQFDNISDDQALLITNAYEAARGSKEVLTLPPEVWAGMADTLKVRLQRDYSWRFAEAPGITSGAPGFSSITVKLDGQRDG
jgi:hypothetical protein